MAELYIITGSNGAGKSTVGPDYLPQHIRQNNTVFDGDKLYMQKQKDLWQSGIRAHKSKKLAFEFVERTFDSLVGNALLLMICNRQSKHFLKKANCCFIVVGHVERCYPKMWLFNASSALG